MKLDTIRQFLALSPTSPSGLIWICKSGDKVKIDSKAGCKGRYWFVRLDGQLHKAHRIVYMLFHNCEIPDNIEVDHIDRNKYNNDPKNLRLVESRQNNYNRDILPNNTSGFTGVRKRGNKYQSFIQIFGKQINLGTYTNIEDASKAYEDAKSKEMEA